MCAPTWPQDFRWRECTHPLLCYYRSSYFEGNLFHSQGQRPLSANRCGFCCTFVQKTRVKNVNQDQTFISGSEASTKQQQSQMATVINNGHVTSLNTTTMMGLAPLRMSRPASPFPWMLFSAMSPWAARRRNTPEARHSHTSFLSITIWRRPKRRGLSSISTALIVYDRKSPKRAIHSCCVKPNVILFTVEFWMQRTA